MKILFINKYDTSGGAAIAAWRLHEQLEADPGTENVFLVGQKRSSSPIVRETRKPGLERFLERGSNFLLNRMGLQYVWFPFSDARIRALVRELKPDVISMHNIHGGYFSTGLIRDISARSPVVWTLHDMWAFTGNAVHTFGDESWKSLRRGAYEHRSFPSIGLPTGHWLLRRKKRIYGNSDLTIVTPSRWLYDLARQSPLLENKRLVQIYNGVDLRKFIPGNRAEAKMALGIDPAMKVVSFSAEKLMDSEHKGGKTLLDVLRVLDAADSPVCLLTIGGGHIPQGFPSLKVVEMGYLTDEARYIQCLQASDVYMHPTKADTLPNTLIEAIACATPCVVFDVGGCPEIIVDQENGYVIPPFDYNLFAEAIRRLLHNDTHREILSRQARAYAEKEFDIRVMAARYLALFHSVVSGE
jgi:glycosyltransferase involved in cell wall biosynthesis